MLVTYLQLNNMFMRNSFLQILLFYLTILKYTSGNQHIVCETCADYTMKTENCENNYDVLSDVPSITKRHGFKHETYYVTTEDGIKTAIYRVLPRNIENGHNTPVFIQHGLQMDATVWVSVGNRSLAFRLSNMGYDVWLGNFRNSHVSTQINYDPHRYFFNFSFHELAIYDLNSQIEFVAEKTNRRGDIIFIGHSMGNSAAFIYSIDLKAKAERNLRVLITLGPPEYLHHSPHFFDGKLLTQYMVSYGRQLAEVYGYGAFWNYTDFNQFAVNFCTTSELTCTSCIYMSQFVAGYDLDELSPKDIPILVSYGMYANPLKVLLHYITMSHYNNSTRYEYQLTPDNYDIYDYKKINLPVYIFYGSNDKFADEEDVLIFYKELQTEKAIFNITGANTLHGFNHIDFIWAKNIDSLHRQLFDVIKKFTY